LIVTFFFFFFFFLPIDTIGGTLTSLELQTLYLKRGKAVVKTTY
jgi:hypothetical protein